MLQEKGLGVREMTGFILDLIVGRNYILINLSKKAAQD